MKVKDIKSLSKEERAKKLEELKLELVKANVNSSQSGAKIKNIKKIIARIVTLNTDGKEVLKKQ